MEVFGYWSLFFGGLIRIEVLGYLDIYYNFFLIFSNTPTPITNKLHVYDNQ